MNAVQDREAELLLELEGILSDERKDACRENYRLFRETYLKKSDRADAAEFHHEMEGLLREMVLKKSAEQINRLLFVAPRGFAKSMICSVEFALWLAVYGHRKDVFLVSATISLAKEMLRQIRVELESNELILKDFGELQSDKWTEEHLVLKNSVVLRAKGRGFQMRGFRPDMIICDDLEDEEVIYSKDQRDKMWHWFFRTLIPTLKPNQDLLYVGTNLHQLSLIAKLQEKPEFVCKKYCAITGGRSIWEAHWPTETLLKLRTEIGEYAFLAEYQNSPISLEDQPVKPHFLDGVSIPGEPDVLCLAIDPAISEKEGSDERALVLLGRIKNAETGETKGFRELFSEKGRWGIEEQLDKVIGVYERYQKLFPKAVFRILFEAVAFQKVYGPLLRKRGKEKGLWLPISEVTTGIGDNKRPKDKYMRLMQVIHILEQRYAEVRNPDLYNELIIFPSGDSDNLLDAFVYALYWLVSFQKGGFMQKKEEKQLPVGTRKSYYVHEVRPGVYVADTAPPKLKPKMRLLSFK